MTSAQSKTAVHVFLAALAMLQLSMLVLREQFGASLGIMIPLVSFLTVAGLIALWWQWRVSAHRSRRIFTQSQQLKQEVMALNKHAMVVLTDAGCKIDYVNQQLLKLTGYEEKELLGQPLDVLYFDEDLGQLKDQRSKSEIGATWQGESRVKKRDGGELWTNLTFMPSLNTKGQVCGSISVRTDITDVMRLKAEKEVFQALSSVPDEIYIFDLESLLCKYANAEARRNLPGGALIEVGALITDIDPIFDSIDFAVAVDSVIHETSGFVHFELARGDRKHQAQIKLMPNNAGGQDALLILRDVSELLKAEQIKSEFISTVSHELRSPMTSIKGSLGLVLAGSGGEISQDVERILSIAHRNADRLILIINDLLDIEKIAAGKMTFEFATYDLCEIVDEAILANECYARNLQVSVEREGDQQAFVTVDFDRTLQLVNNLISNAAKFSDRHSKVIVRILSGPTGTILEVQDHGNGIPESLRDVVFEKFSAREASNVSSVRGTGLGLAIVKAIAEHQNCKIGFDTEVGVGTTFRVDFPSRGALPESIRTKQIESIAN